MKRTSSILLASLILLSLASVTVMGDPVVTDITDEDGATISGGVYGDVVRVLGTDVTAGDDVNLYWDNVGDWDDELAEGLLNSSEAQPDGTFEIWFEVPEAVNGDHYLWIRDSQGTGGPEAFSVDAMIRLSPSSGLTGDSITIKGHGFGKTKNVDDIEFDTANLVTTPGVPVSNSLGYWQATFNVPSKADNDYTVRAEDSAGNFATATFTIGPAISLDVEEGNVGTVVEVDGRGFTPSDRVSSITLDGIDCGVIDDDDLDIDGSGEFTFEFVVPSVSRSEKEYELEVSDGVKDARIYFYVTELTSITVDPMFGPPGASVSIDGINFAPNMGVSVTIDGSGEKTFTTNSKGKFSGSYTIAALSSGTYDLVAEQADFNIEDTKSFRVGTMVVILSPTTGPSGKLIAITGTGFTAGGEWNASINGKILLKDESVSGDTTLFGTFYVPTLKPGTYDVIVTDVDEGIQVSKGFTVTENTSITLEPMVAPVEFNITIEGSYFAESDGTIDVDFKIYNSTDDWNMDVYQGTDSVTTGEDGEFTAWWIVPNILSEGTYTINATDEEGLFAQSSFSVGPIVVSINSRKAVYNEGDTIGFNIESSYMEVDSYITILDPDGNFVWKTDDLDNWISVGVTYVVPLYIQTAGGNPMTLESDAPLGTWNYAWYDGDDNELGSGSFIVEEVTSEEEEEPEEEPSDGGITETEYDELITEIEGLRQEVTQLELEAAQLKSTVEQLSSTTSGAMDEVATDINSIEDDIEDALKSAEDVKTEFDQVKSDAKQALNTARTQSTLTYAALGASLIAILLGLVGPIKISRNP